MRATDVHTAPPEDAIEQAICAQPVTQGPVRWTEVTGRSVCGAAPAVIPFPGGGANRGATAPPETALPDAFEAAITPVLQRARAAGRPAALLVLRLGEYRLIEETHGHPLAAALIELVLDRARQCLRPEDVLHRVGRDELAIALDRLENTEEALTIAERLLAHCTGVYLLAGLRLRLHARIGIALYPDDAAQPEKLLRYARVALRETALERTSQCQLFSSELLSRLHQRVWMVAELEQALEQQRLELHYQPQYAIDTQRIVGVEVLVRLRGESGELIGPDRCIGLAEETGLIVPLGRWVIEAACHQLGRWHRAGAGHLRMAVNVSPLQLLQPGFVEIIDEAVERAGIAHSDLELEITEQQVMEHLPQVEQTLRELSLKGVRLAVDDFGTGYSSLAYLMRLSINTVKIDRSFMAEIPHDRQAARVVSAIIAMSAALGLGLTVEGIETEAQHRFLLEAGCARGQGDRFARAQSAEAIERFF